MNYTQRQRIQQITEKTLIIGADIAKFKHVARAQDSRGIELGKHLIFENTSKGFAALLAWLEKIKQANCKDEVIFGMEPTGHYWLPLAQFLREAGIKVVVVNPMHVKKSKELDDNSPTKNDVKDARVIAQLVKDGRYSEPIFLTGEYAELRNAMVQRDRLNANLIQVKNQVQNWLDRYFPEYLTVFKKWEGKASLLTLENFPLPQDVLAKGVTGVVTQWKTQVKRAVGIKRASLLVDAARTSIGLTHGLTMAREELKMYLDQYAMYVRQLESIETQVKTILSQIPGTEEMMSIKGIGWITIAGFLAEVGKLDNYKHPQQIVKLTGINLKENTSGKHKGRTEITKRGRPRLRALLFRAVLVLVAKNPEFKELHKYYTTRKENPLKKKQSIVALCAKLIRILFAVGSQRKAYDPKKVMGPQIKLVA
ncbi:MAG: IS110 family transposase [Bacillota bacterium]